MSLHNKELSKTLYQPNINIFNNEKDLVKTINIFKSFHEVEGPDDQNHSRKIKEKQRKSTAYLSIKHLVINRMNNMNSLSIADSIMKKLQFNKSYYESEMKDENDFKFTKILSKKIKSSGNIINHNIHNVNDYKNDNINKEEENLNTVISLKEDNKNEIDLINSNNQQEKVDFKRTYCRTIQNTRFIKKFSNIYDSLSDNEDIEFIPYKYSIHPSNMIINIWNCLISIYYIFIILSSSVLAFISINNYISPADYVRYFICVDVIIYINIFLTIITGSKKRNLISYSIKYNFSKNNSQIIIQILSSFPLSLIRIISICDITNISCLNIGSLIFLPKLLLVFLYFKWIKLSYIFKENNKMIELLNPFFRNNKLLLLSINFIGKIKGFICMIIYFFLIIHICSCIMIYFGLALDYLEENTWIRRFYMEKIGNINYFDIYSLSFYFIMSTLITVGYGDIVATNIYERVFCIGLLIVGCLFYSYIITTISFIFKNHNKYLQIFNEKTEILNRIRNTYQISNNLYKIINRYLDFNYKDGDMERQEFLQSLPNVIKNELSFKMYSKKILKLEFFSNLIMSKDLLFSINSFFHSKSLNINKNIKMTSSHVSEKNKIHSENFLLFVVPFLNRHIYNRTEYIWTFNQFVNEMFMIISGKANFCIGYEYQNYSICSLGDNKHYGEVLMFSDTHLSSFDILASSNKIEIFTLGRREFHIINETFPEIVKKILNSSIKNHIEIESLRTIAIEYYKVYLTFDGFSKIVKSIYREEIKNHILESNYKTKLNLNQKDDKNKRKLHFNTEVNLKIDNKLVKDKENSSNTDKSNANIKEFFISKPIPSNFDNSYYTDSNGNSINSFFSYNSNYSNKIDHKNSQGFKSVSYNMEKIKKGKKSSLKEIINNNKNFNLLRKREFEEKIERNKSIIADNNIKNKKKTIEKKLLYQGFLFNIYNNKRMLFKDRVIMNNSYITMYSNNNTNLEKSINKYKEIHKNIVKYKNDINLIKITLSKTKNLKKSLMKNQKEKENRKEHLINKKHEHELFFNDTNKAMTVNNKILDINIINNNSNTKIKTEINKRQFLIDKNYNSTINDLNTQVKDESMSINFLLKSKININQKESSLKKEINKLISIKQDDRNKKKLKSNKNIKRLINLREKKEKRMFTNLEKNIIDSYHLENDKNVEKLIKEYLIIKKNKL